MKSRWRLGLLVSSIAIIAACGGGGGGGSDPITPTPPQATGYPGRIWEPSPPQYGNVIVPSTVTLSDGTVLAARISYPTNLATGERAPGRFPVVLEHTPYNGGQGMPVAGESFTYHTHRGYIYVEVRARGTGTSGGEVSYSGSQDGRDGKEIVDWAANRLDGSDGRIAMVGCSYPAAIMFQTAAHLGPNSPVKAMVSACNGFDSQHRGTFMRGGLLNSNMRAMPSLRSLLGNTPSSIAYFNNLVAEIESGGDAAYDRAFWADKHGMHLAPAIASAGVPMLLWSGWQDRVEGAVRAYTALQNAHAGRPYAAPMIEGQVVTPRYQLIMGDWGHAQGLDQGVFHQWIETWLKGVNTGIQNTTTPMHLADPGTGGYTNIARFPMTRVNNRWFLGPSATLSRTVPANTGSDQLIWQDPALAGGRVSYSTEPLAAGTLISGPMSATIYASSNNTNLMMVATLWDVAPDGTAVEITKAAVLGSQRELDFEKSWTDEAGTVTWPWPKLDRDQYLTPDQVYRFDIAMLVRHWSIKPGHRLRLEITGQSPPALCAANTSGTSRSRGWDPCTFTPQQQATLPGGVYRIMTGPQTPSAVNLPELPYASLLATGYGILPTETAAPATSKRPFPLDW